MTTEDRRPQPLWAVRRDDIQWSSDLTFHGERVGWEVTVARDGHIVNRRVFGLRDVALAWSTSERDDVERGYRD
jgi:hypothetical protein